MAKTNSGLLEFKDAQKVLIALDDATSEVKKAVVIDGDGAETDIQGVQPTGKKEITTTAEVNVANYATAQVVDEDLIAGNIKKDVDILGVVGSYEAPASDFSTAEVTFINNTIAEEYIFGAIIDSDMIQYDSEIGTGTSTKQVAIYKSGSKAYVDDEEATISVSGDATYNDGVITITGDCTITIS